MTATTLYFTDWRLYMFFGKKTPCYNIQGSHHAKHNKNRPLKCERENISWVFL